jgi:hypothetical protein
MSLQNGVLLLAALNLALNAALGLVILLRYPWPVWPIPIGYPDHLAAEARCQINGERRNVK